MQPKEMELIIEDKKFVFYYDNREHAANYTGIHGTWSKNNGKSHPIVNMNTRMKLYKHYLELRFS